MIRPFRFWCQKVLPLVYDDSLSYYEVLCKMKEKLNEIIAETNNWESMFDELEKVIQQIQEWIDNFDPEFVKKIIEELLGEMIFVEISDAGYIMYNVPGSWKAITFNTTGLDIELPLQPEYGHLVLSY